MKFSRASGVLLHPTALPSPFGIGDLGPSAEAFLDRLVVGGQRFWQILPLGPTGYGHSPYACYSAFAGNPWLISPERLVADRFLEPSEIEISLSPSSCRASDRIDFEAVRACKLPLFERAFARFRAGVLPAETEAFESFRRDPLIRPWLEDYALFMALKETHEDAVWTAWDPPLALRAPVALAHYAEAEKERILFHEFLQYLFFKQWRFLRGEAQKRKIGIIGDIPIFVAHDSADVWCHPELFELDEMGHPTVVSGVPPDYFSKTGQRWGNPLYRWEAMAATGYAWWVLRFRLLLELVDVVRLDHFRGFEAYWEIPAHEATAVKGKWRKGPGEDFFERLGAALGDLPIIAEDLGVITPEVEALRDRFGFPGMKILQFAFGDTPENGYLPHNFKPECVVYTGTHDNDTIVGWFRSAPQALQQEVCGYLGSAGREIHWDLIRLGLSSVARLAIFPLQDILGLGSEARMNTPGEEQGNWSWRLTEEQLSTAPFFRLQILTHRYGR